ncbi:MAG: hypothetical protein WDO73_03165, partial [Ignavibacteriota bacterium]
MKIDVETLFAQSGKIAAAREDRPKREGELRPLRERVTRNIPTCNRTTDRHHVGIVIDIIAIRAAGGF